MEELEKFYPVMKFAEEPLDQVHLRIGHAVKCHQESPPIERDHIAVRGEGCFSWEFTVSYSL